MTVMSDFLGVEPDRRDEFRVWTLTRIMGMFDPKRNGTPEFVESTEQLRGYFSQRIGEAQRAPVGGLVDRLVESGELSHDEMVDLLIIMLGAGIITTADLIGNTLHALLTTPGELDALRADRSLVPEAIEETLRFDSPALSAGRILTEDTELFGAADGAGHLAAADDRGHRARPRAQPRSRHLLGARGRARSTPRSAVGCTTASACTSASSRRSSP